MGLIQSLPLDFTTLLLVVPVLFFATKGAQTFWKSRGINGPTPIPLLGTRWETFLYSSPEVETRRYQKYGKLYGTYEAGGPTLVVGQPELIKLITVKDWHLFADRRESSSEDYLIRKNLLGLKGDRWKAVRALLSPTFTSGKIRRMMDLINESVDHVLQILDSPAGPTHEVDVQKLFGAFTSDVIASCAFATKTSAHTNPDDPLVKYMNKLVKVGLVRALTFLVVPKFLMRSLGFDVLSGEISDFFKDLGKHLLKQRRQSKVKRNDFLQFIVDAGKRHENLREHMLDISEGHFVNEQKEEIEANAKALGSVKLLKLTEEESIAQMFLFFIAGFETTRSVLSYSSYALALNEDVQDKLYAEISTHFSVESVITYDELNKLEYLNAVISETLRMYTPVLRMERVSGTDYALGETGLTIPKGTVIVLPFYAIHHDADYFPEPYKFDPSRFLKENIDQIKPYTYMPFGVGPRNCIGMRFALAEAKLALSKILLNFKIAPTASTPKVLQYKKNPGLLQCQPIKVAFVKRSAS